MKGFDAESHFESKIKTKSLRAQGVVIDFSARPFTPTARPVEKGLRRVAHGAFRYADFAKINTLHTAYLAKLRGRLSPDAFLPILHGAELTGAAIRIRGEDGYIIEERKNSLVVIFLDDRVRVFPKDVWDFSLIADGVEYYFFARALKKNRFTR